MSEWSEKKYGKIEDVPHFDRHGMGPDIQDLSVTANLSPNRNFPSTRIYVGVLRESKDGDIGGLCFTVENARKLRKMLGDAIADVERAIPTIDVVDEVLS